MAPLMRMTLSMRTTTTTTTTTRGFHERHVSVAAHKVRTTCGRMCKRLSRDLVYCKAANKEDNAQEENEEYDTWSKEIEDWMGTEDHPLLRRDREERASDYIGGKEWRQHRDVFPRVYPDGKSKGELKEAVFPDNFYGTRLQRQVFPEDTDKRAYVEYDTLPSYEGDVLHKAEEVEALMDTGRVDEKEMDFWFNNSDMPEAGYPLKIEMDKLNEYEQQSEKEKMLNPLNDAFTVFCPSVEDAPPAQDNLSQGQELTGKVMGAHLQYGVLVDLGR